MTDTIPFKFPGVNDRSNSSPPVGAKFVAPDKTDDIDHYPSPNDSLHTMVAGNSDPSSKKEGHKPNFMARAFYIGWLLFWVSLVRTFVVNLASVTAQNGPGGLFGIEFPVVSGIATWFAYALAQHVIYSVDPVIQIGELGMAHYSSTVGPVHQRILLWVICFLFVLGGAIVGVAIVLGLDGSHFSGTPIVPPGMLWQAFGMEIMGQGIFTWVFFAGYFNPESWANKRKTNVPLMLGLTTTATTWIAIPYSTGCFNIIRYLASSLVSEHWEEHGWVFVAGPAIGALFFGVLAFWAFRTTKMGEVWHQD
jgi:hypothetical protein